jgi:hypothetical protein
VTAVPADRDSFVGDVSEDGPYRSAASVRSMRKVSAHEALVLLFERREVVDVEVEEEINLRDLDPKVHHGVVRFENCRLAGVDLSHSTFEKPVSFTGCTIGSLFAMSAFFIAGFSMDLCTVEEEAELSYGGHNKNGGAFTLTDCTFRCFVDFTDAWFMGPLTIARCRFQSGANLLGNRDHPMRVSFDVAPALEANEGDLAIDTEPWQR